MDDLNIFVSEFGKNDCPYDEFYYFHNDHLGTPRRITDQNGIIVWPANYVPFGETTITTNTISNPFRFPGQYYDNETGLYYNWHRYYDPAGGRYLRVDPSHSVQPRGVEETIPYPFPYLLNTPQELNLCSYVQNNPTNAIDTRGLKSKVRGFDPFNVCKGKWRIQGIDHEHITHTCTCYWLCVPCTGEVIWGGNYRNLKDITVGFGIWEGSGDPGEATGCACPPPGPEERCDECE